MAIEIKQLTIKTTVGENQPGNAPAADSGGAENMDAIIQICVEKVMEKLKEKSER